MADEHFSYGGQAVIEGVMIRGKKGYATAFRLADGGIEVEKHEYVPVSKRHPLLGLAFVRGTPSLRKMSVKSTKPSGENALPSTAHTSPQSLVLIAKGPE